MQIKELYDRTRLEEGTNVPSNGPGATDLSPIPPGYGAFIPELFRYKFLCGHILVAQGGFYGGLFDAVPACGWYTSWA
jgi:hypothetical protein